MVYSALQAYNNKKIVFTPSYIKIAHVTHNMKTALWQMPYNKEYLNYDEDGSRWFETYNANGNDELERVKKELKINTSDYLVLTETTYYEDGSYKISSKYPNRNTVIENHKNGCIYAKIKNKFNQLVADKIFNKSSKEGRKNIYETLTNGNNKLTIVKVYSYDTSKNKAYDIIDYGYTSSNSVLTDGCNFETKYYLLNGDEVSDVEFDGKEYIVKTKDGKILTFSVE